MSPRCLAKRHLCQRATIYLVFCLMPGPVFQSAVPGCQVQRTDVSGFAREGDILIGGIFPIHDASVYPEITFEEEPAPITCQTFVYDYYLWLQAMVFAVEDINRNPDLLPNVTLGFWIYDSCRMLRPVLEGTLWILTGRGKPVLNYQCWRTRQPAAIIGDSLSSRSIIMARILGLYKYPQISYSASNPLLSDRIQFPSFFRTVPSDDYQSQGLAQLVMEFGWTWVGLLAEDSDYGQQGIRLLQQELIKGGACVAFSENIISNKDDKNARRIAEVIKNSTANAIVVFSFDPDLAVVLDELLKQKVTGKIWVASEAWASSSLLSTEKYAEILSGTIGFATHSGEMPGFKEHLTNVRPSSCMGFIGEFWEHAFSCKWQDQKATLNVPGNTPTLCTGTEKLQSLQIYQNDVTGFTVSYNVYRAVYAIAVSLQDLSACRPGRGPFHQGACADITDYRPWQLLHYVKNMCMQRKVGTETFFDRHGNPPALYDIVNWQQSAQGTFKQVKVGGYDSSAPPGETLLINTSAILWNGGSREVPVSVCSPSCAPGLRKAEREGKPICCFQCVPCPLAEISNQTDSIECSRCPWDQWPNEKQDRCIPKTTDFLSYEETLGATLAAASLFLSVIPAAILGVFIHYRNTAIVKANNRSLSYLLLLSLTLCFLCSLAFIGYPTPEKCLLRQAAFGITFALCVSCILAKTIMVVIAFNATKPNSNLRRWVGPQLSYTMISACTLFQVVLCVCWLILSPPFFEYNTQTQPGKIIFECNEGSSIALWCMLGYLGLMATISFIVAFLARNLPDSFNEACLAKRHLCQRATIYLVFCLMPGPVFQSAVPGCQVQRTDVSGFAREGDILIGGIFPIHDASVYPEITFEEEPAPITCQTFVYDYYLWLQAMVFAVEDINRNPDLLPNVTLGFWIYDSCRMLRPVLEGTLWILTGRGKPVLNYQCWRTRQPAAIIGDSLSSRSIIMARILGLYKYPQISYSASNPLLSDRIQFPSFFRTVPSDDYQSQGLAQLVMEFGWTWVGLLAEDSDYGQQGIRLLQQELIKGGACVAFSENIISNKDDKNARRIAEVIKNSTANAIVVFSFDPDLAVVLDELLKQKVTGKIWVASEAWASSSLLSTEKYAEILSGTIGFATHSGEMPGFKEYLTNVHPSSYMGFIREFWEHAFSCKWQDQKATLNVPGNTTTLCTGTEKLQSLQIYQNDVTGFTVSYNVYRAVYAIAVSLQDLSACRPGGGPFHQGACADITDYRPWQLLHYVKNMCMQRKVGTETFFDRHGNPPALYDIVNWQQSAQGTFKQVKVGGYDSSAPPGETLLINTSAILWNGGSREVPVSVCSPSCAPGLRKAEREGKPICCFQCVPCPLAEISNQTDSIECSRCPWDQWPNEKQDRCIPKTTDFLSYEETLGATLAAASLFLSVIPAAILGVFIHYRNTAIVKANNRSLSYLLLLSLTLCFLCSLAFIGYPTPEKCLLRQAAFGITFALCVSCILAKTIMVVIAFNATKPNSNLRRWVGPQLSYTMISACTLFQVVLCVCWLILSPPFFEYNTQTQPGKIIFECNEGSSIALWCMLGYLGLMATISFIVAFLARNLPDSFNEAKFITFSMLAFLSVWISFIPAYLSTRGKYMVAMEIFAILTSSFALVSCIFYPKCYIILLRPEMNTKEHLIGRGAGHTKG